MPKRSKTSQLYANRDPVEERYLEQAESASMMKAVNERMNAKYEGERLSLGETIYHTNRYLRGMFDPSILAKESLAARAEPVSHEMGVGTLEESETEEEEQPKIEEYAESFVQPPPKKILMGEATARVTFDAIKDNVNARLIKETKSITGRAFDEFISSIVNSPSGIPAKNLPKHLMRLDELYSNLHPDAKKGQKSRKRLYEIVRAEIEQLIHDPDAYGKESNARYEDIREQPTLAGETQVDDALGESPLYPFEETQSWPPAADPDAAVGGQVVMEDMYVGPKTTQLLNEEVVGTGVVSMMNKLYIPSWPSMSQGRKKKLVAIGNNSSVLKKKKH